jgi:hypothetical protein
MTPDRTNLPYTSQSEQSVLNRSQDSKYDVIAVELLVENDAENALVRLKRSDLGGSSNSSATFDIRNIEEDATYKYFGFEERGGTDWRIMRKTLATSTFLYATGTTDYATNWTGKAGLTYA